MKLLLVGLYSDGSNGRDPDVLLERSALIGGEDIPEQDELLLTDRAINEIFSAKEALEKSQGVYGKYLVVLEPDEA